MKFVEAALICVMMSVLLDGLGFRAKRLFVCLTVIIMMIGLVGSLSKVFDPILNIARDVGIGEVADKSLRAVGLGYVFGFTSDICSSLGETTLASLVTAVGRVEIFLIALPYFIKTVELGIKLLS